MERERMVISATDAAIMLSTSQERILELLDRGEIPAYRDGRNWKIPVKALEEYLMEKASVEARLRRELKAKTKGEKDA